MSEHDANGRIMEEQIDYKEEAIKKWDEGYLLWHKWMKFLRGE